VTCKRRMRDVLEPIGWLITCQKKASEIDNIFTEQLPNITRKYILKIVFKIGRFINTSLEGFPNNYMENRIDRKDDRSLYQPKIHSERVKTLYSLKQATRKPMTVLLDQAIRDLAENYGVVYQVEKEPVLVNVEPETWEDVCEYRKFLDELDYQKCLDEVEIIKSDITPTQK
jgi:hypothetical protein